MLKKIYTNNQELQLIQDNVGTEINKLELLPPNNGIFLEDINLISGQDNIINHSLGRTPISYIVAGLDSNSVVWSTPSAQLNNFNFTSEFINLQCSASCGIDLWVF